MGSEKRIFLAATRQNDGKTVTCIGMVGRLMELTKKVGFIKPVGQRYVEVDGFKIDEDAVLVKSMLGPGSPELRDMSPVAIDRGFTEEYLDSGDPGAITRRIIQSYENVSRDKDVVVIEGTGHAGVGSVIDLNNAQVAKLLGAKVILISIGGIGKPIDEIALNQALFEREGVEILGAVINKVIPEKKEKIDSYLAGGLAKRGIDLLGSIPYTQSLTITKMSQLAEALGLEFVAGRECAENCVQDIVVGAMLPHNALKYMNANSLLVTPGDREDLILASMSFVRAGENGSSRVGGIIMTGGLRPHKKILEIVKGSGVPVLLSKENTYIVASKLHDLVVKIRVGDDEKINTAKGLIEKHVNMEKIFSKLG